MNTRKDVQAALDLVKSANVVNDLLDCLSWQLQGIDPGNGGPFMVQPSADPASKRDPTESELRDMAVRGVQNCGGYIRNMEDHIGKRTKADVAKSLAVFGLDYDEFVADVAVMKEEMAHIAANAPTADKAGLAEVGKRIDNNIPKLGLVRRMWNR